MSSQQSATEATWDTGIENVIEAWRAFRAKKENEFFGLLGKDNQLLKNWIENHAYLKVIVTRLVEDHKEGMRDERPHEFENLVLAEIALTIQRDSSCPILPRIVRDNIIRRVGIALGTTEAATIWIPVIDKPEGPKWSEFVLDFKDVHSKYWGYINGFERLSYIRQALHEYNLSPICLTDIENGILEKSNVGPEEEIIKMLLSMGEKAYAIATPEDIKTVRFSGNMMDIRSDSVPFGWFSWLARTSAPS